MTRSDFNDHSDDEINYEMSDSLATNTDQRLNLLNTNCKYYELSNLKTLTFDDGIAYEYCVLFINIHSLPAKFDQLNHILSCFEDAGITIHFILLCETFLTEDNKSLYNINNYHLECENRKFSTKGGVAVYYRDTFSCTRNDTISINIEREFQSLFLEIKTKTKSIMVGVIYRIPNTNQQTAISRYDTILSKLSSLKNTDIILGSDSNFDYTKVDTHTNSSNLLNSFFIHNILPTVNKPTRVTHSSATLIDNIYLHCKDYSNTISGILLTDISDHSPIFAFTGKQSNLNETIPTFIKRRVLNDYNTEAIKNELLSKDFSYLEQYSTNESYLEFLKVLNVTIDKYAPLKTIKITKSRRPRQPWITPDLIKQGRKCDNMYVKQINKHPEDELSKNYKKY